VQVEPAWGLVGGGKPPEAGVLMHSV